MNMVRALKDAIALDRLGVTFVVCMLQPLH